MLRNNIGYISALSQSHAGLQASVLNLIWLLDIKTLTWKIFVHMLLHKMNSLGPPFNTKPPTHLSGISHFICVLVYYFHAQYKLYYIIYAI